VSPLLAAIGRLISYFVGLDKDRQLLGTVVHSSNELLQWLCHDDSTTNIFLVISLVIGIMLVD